MTEPIDDAAPVPDFAAYLAVAAPLLPEPIRRLCPSPADMTATWVMLGPQVTATLTPAQVLTLAVARNRLRLAALRAGPAEAIAATAELARWVAAEPAAALPQAAFARLIALASADIERWKGYQA
jgi:hypothetical protein